MPQIVVAAVAAVAGFVANTFAAIGLVSFGAFAGNLILAIGPALLNIGASLLIGKIFAPKRPPAAERQAQVLELSLGETAREAVFGRAATGGSLNNAWNDGGQNEYESVVIVLADHECDAVEGYYIEDTYYALTDQGAQLHADLQDGGPVLWVETRLGAPGQTVASIISTQGVAAGEWTSGEAAASFKGLCYAVVRYKISDKVWKSGRPRFRWLVRGLKCYDPRKDSTVPGGSGTHRWGEPETYEWSRNARVCHYNYIRGVWNYASDPPQLVVGPGRTEEEAPPAEAIAGMNLCDEAVTLKAGGTEPRYIVAAVVRADEPWIQVEDEFAAAMGGELVERSGTIGVDAGAAKTSSFDFTDADLISGRALTFKGKVTRNELINSVVARYIEPTQLWEIATAPIRRSLEDIAEDGEIREATLELGFVPSGTQAQRCAEIVRRKGRKQMTAAVALGPKYMTVEQGDWGTWTSQRRFNGDSRVMEVLGALQDAQGTTLLGLKHIGSDCYSWVPATDELDADNPAYLAPGALSDAELEDVAVEPTTRTDGSQQIPAIRVTWTAPTDASIKSVLIQWRQQGASLISSNTTADVAAGEYVIDAGLIGLATYEVRVTPLTTPQRGEISSSWLEVTVPEASGNQSLNFTPVLSSNMLVFGRSLRKVAGELQPLEWDDGADIEWDDATALEWELLGWDGHAFSAESYVGGASALGIVVDTDKALMFGLSADPSADDHYDGITFAWRVSEDGKLSVWEEGELVWDNDGVPEDAEANDVLSVIYDGAHTRYYVSGVLKHESEAAAGLRLYFDTSFYSDGARLDGVSFASAAAAGSTQETRYKRSVAPPATPTDVDPAGWSIAVPSGNEALWSTTSTKTLSGALVSGWSTPALMTTPNWRGTYNDATTYYREDAVTYTGGSYRCIVESVVGRAPSGTGQDNPFWALISASGGTTPPETPPAEFTATIELATSTEGANLYDLAVAEGYTGHGDATIAFVVPDGVSITGLAGSPDGGHAITTGVWPVGYTFALSIEFEGSSFTRGGGGKGGKGGDCNPGAQVGDAGGKGGDALQCLVPIDVIIRSGARLQGGGGGGGGGDGRQIQTGIFSVSRIGGGGGGGGQPNGPGGVQGYGSTTSNTPGSAATTSSAGSGGTGSGYAGRNGGAYGADGAAASSSGAPGAGGYCIRKNGHTVNVTDEGGVIAGTIG